MNCEDLDAWLDETLPAARRPAFEQHLATCAACQAGRAQWEELQAAGARWRKALPAEAPFSAPELVRRAQAGAPRRPLRWVALTAALATLLIAAVVAWRLSASPVPPQPWVAPPVLVAGQPFASPGYVASAEQEPVELALALDRYVVGRMSRVTLETVTAQRVRLRLGAGRVTVSASKRTAGATLEVESADALVTVVGTKFDVRRSAEGTSVHVLEGSVRVTAHGQTELVEANQALEVTGERLDRRALSADERSELTDPMAPEPSPAPSPQRVNPARATAAQLSAWTRRIVGGDLARVEAELVEHLTRAPSDAAALSLLADCRRKAGKTESAARTYEKVAAVAPAVEAQRARLLAAGLWQEQLGEPRKAVDPLRQWLREASANDALRPGVLLRLCRAHESLGQTSQAVAQCQRVVTEHPASSEANDARKRLTSLEQK